MDERVKTPVCQSEIEELPDNGIIYLLRNQPLKKTIRKAIKDEMLIRIFEEVKYLSRAKSD